jgi:hypothetical protein
MQILAPTEAREKNTQKYRFLSCEIETAVNDLMQNCIIDMPLALHLLQ